MSDLRKLLDEATPGPWVQDGRNQRRINVESGYGAKVAQASVFADWRPVEEKRAAYQTCEANARLIALAPDLAAALLKAEEALAYYRDQFCEGFCRDVPPGFTSKEMEIDCSGCRARATLTEIRNLTGDENGNPHDQRR